MPNDAPPAETPTGNFCDKYRVEHPVERRLVSGFLRAFDAMLPAAAPARVLEVGAGEGEISARVRERFPDALVVSVDLHDDVLGKEWREREATGAFADVHRLPFPAASFDLVLGIEVLEHVARPADALAEIRRVARDAVVLSVPREPIWRAANVLRGRYVRDFGNTPGHVNHWSTRRFRRLVRGTFDVGATRTPFPWTILSARRRTSS